MFALCVLYLYVCVPATSCLSSIFVFYFYICTFNLHIEDITVFTLSVLFLYAPSTLIFICVCSSYTFSTSLCPPCMFNLYIGMFQLDIADIAVVGLGVLYLYLYLYIRPIYSPIVHHCVRFLCSVFILYTIFILRISLCSLSVFYIYMCVSVTP